jgi:2-(1,2-epoxy-1,2-dihydrophenyl)acetyl-CoA isomerase
MSNQELILYEVSNRIATITINRSDKAHAFSIEMLQMMHSRLLEADEDESAKCILIKSTGERFFSAGYDLKEIQGAPEKISQITEWGRKVNETILMIKKPIITQIKGIAVGFGVLMILASDLRIFADRSKDELYLRLPEIAISAFPQTGATLLPLLGFGLTYAKNMLFTADKAGLDELKNINFPTRIFPLKSIDLETRKFLKILTKHQTEFLFFIKSMLTIMNKAYIKSCFDLEDECGKLAFSKKSMKELDAFIKTLHEKYP